MAAEVVSSPALRLLIASLSQNNYTQVLAATVLLCSSVSTELYNTLVGLMVLEIVIIALGSCSLLYWLLLRLNMLVP